MLLLVITPAPEALEYAIPHEMGLGSSGTFVMTKSLADDENRENGHKGKTNGYESEIRRPGIWSRGCKAEQ